MYEWKQLKKIHNSETGNLVRSVVWLIIKYVYVCSYCTIVKCLAVKHVDRVNKHVFSLSYPQRLICHTTTLHFILPYNTHEANGGGTNTIQVLLYGNPTSSEWTVQLIAMHV